MYFLYAKNLAEKLSESKKTDFLKAQIDIKKSNESYKAGVLVQKSHR